MIYSIPYVLLIILFGVLAIYYHNTEDSSSKRTIRIVCALILIFFFGFRGYICDDWIAYYPAFQKCSPEYINFNPFEYNIKWAFEPGFTILMCLCKSIVDDFQFFSFVCTVINTFLLFRFFNKRIDNLPLGIILYLCFGGYIMNTNLMRNSIAILIFINALEYIEKRKPLQYFSLCLLALSFHISSICYFPLYFFFQRKYSKCIYLGLFAVGNIIFILRIPIFITIMSFVLGDSEGKIQLMVDGYTEKYDSSTTISIGYIERLMTGLLIFCYYDKLVKIRKENIIFINAYIVYFLMFFLLSEFNIISLRMSGLFTFAYWIIWYDFLKCFSINNNKKLYIAFVTLYCIMKMIGTTNMITSQYDNILFGSKSYEERLYIHNRYSKN